MIKKGIINFKYFNFDIKSCSLFYRLEVAVGKKIRQQTCCLYVLSHSSTLHHVRKISAESIMAVLTPKSGIMSLSIWCLSLYSYFIRFYYEVDKMRSILHKISYPHDLINKWIKGFLEKSLAPKTIVNTLSKTFKELK